MVHTTKKLPLLKTITFNEKADFEHQTNKQHRWALSQFFGIRTVWVPFFNSFFGAWHPKSGCMTSGNDSKYMNLLFFRLSINTPYLTR